MPDSLAAAPSDTEACLALLRHGSRSFHMAGLLLPRRLRPDVAAVYAFCRVADDAIDLCDVPCEALGRLEARLDGVYAGAPADDPVDRALAVTVARHDLPRPLFSALLEGFAWDAERRTYETLSDVVAYAARVAGSVGALMTLMMGSRDPVALARACDLGVAMQLTNIARDVGEDARAGRLYLPRLWLVEAGLSPQAFVEAPAFTPALGGVVRRLLDCATPLYARAGAGIGQLPPDCRRAIEAARRIYADIGRSVARAGYDSVSRRAVVPAWRKLVLLAWAQLAPYVRRPPSLAPCLPETQFLLRAATEC